MRERDWKRFQLLDMKKATSVGSLVAFCRFAYRKYLPFPNCSFERLKLSEFLCIKIW